MKQEKRAFYKEPDAVTHVLGILVLLGALKSQPPTLVCSSDPMETSSHCPGRICFIFFPQGKGFQSWNSFLSCGVVSSCQKCYLTSCVF